MKELDLYSLETSDIQSRQDFVRFLNDLLADYHKNGKDWENQNLGDFLEALAAYATDVEGFYHNVAKSGGEKIDADSAAWRVFADILRGATVYE